MNGQNLDFGALLGFRDLAGQPSARAGSGETQGEGEVPGQAQLGRMNSKIGETPLDPPRSSDHSTQADLGRRFSKVGNAGENPLF